MAGKLGFTGDLEDVQTSDGEWEFRNKIFPDGRILAVAGFGDLNYVNTPVRERNGLIARGNRASAERPGEPLEC